MYNISYTQPALIKGEITFKRFPQLGIETDINGKRWHIRGIINNIVQAIPADEIHPHFTSTTNVFYIAYHQTWEPYKYLIAEDKDAT